MKLKHFADNDWPWIARYIKQLPKIIYSISPLLKTVARNLHRVIYDWVAKNFHFSLSTLAMIFFCTITIKVSKKSKYVGI